jgi:hypothetical protein
MAAIKARIARLGQAELLRRCREAAGFDHFHEGPELVEVEPLHSKIFSCSV